jgi:hypothetical protein
VEGKQVRIEVKDTITKIPRKVLNLLEKLKKLRFAVEVYAISRTVLGNEDNFCGSLLDEGLHLVNEGRNGKRGLFSSNFGDDAKGAGIIAAFGDFEIFKGMVQIGQGSGIV